MTYNQNDPLQFAAAVLEMGSPSTYMDIRDAHGSGGGRPLTMADKGIDPFIAAHVERAYRDLPGIVRLWFQYAHTSLLDQIETLRAQRNLPQFIYAAALPNLGQPKIKTSLKIQTAAMCIVVSRRPGAPKLTRSQLASFLAVDKSAFYSGNPWDRYTTEINKVIEGWEESACNSFSCFV